MKRGFAFEFDPPLGWDDFVDSNRYVFHGPQKQELILSGNVIAGRACFHISTLKSSWWRMQKQR
ncbi:MAG TPA: hypothetical protein VJZ00_17640 [Thermoanaerobaculia bacterium]|nr:hypothetical protein [Thermoanaerobaculia bacterium]